ncbi:MAG: penicillin acylase family protein [Acidobacteriota bacterium]
MALRMRWRAPLPRTSGVVGVRGVSGEVRVARDEYGIPHIVAFSERDAAYATGFVHGQDRLFQMDLTRRATAGRLAEVIGMAALSWDRRARRQGHLEASRRTLAALAPEARSVLSAFAQGVNAAVAAASALPPEYAILRATFDPWTELDSVLVVRAMQERLATSSSELTRFRLARRVGLSGARFLLDSRLDGDAVILADRAGPPATRSTHELLVAEAAALGLPLTVPPAGEPVAGREPAGAPESGWAGSAAGDLQGQGSNSWVIAPGRSRTGAPLLANDTHLGLEMPTTFYLIDLEWPGVHVAGATVPGIPGVIIGRNDRVAWGVTILTADNIDYVVERVAADDDRYYLDATVPGGRALFERHDEVIRVQGAEPVVETVRRTRHGVVVDPDWGDGEVLVRDRPETSGGGAIEAVLGYAYAGDFVSFRAAARLHDLPTENLVYADIAGHVGYVPAGAIPLRAHRSGLLPAAGWETGDLYAGWDDPAGRPGALDPAEKFIVTANNRVAVGGRGDDWNRAWISASRAARATALLTGGSPHDAARCRAMQTDTLSRRAVLACEGVASQVGAMAWTGRPEAGHAWAVLSRWDHHFGSGPAPALFAVFWERLKAAAFADDVGERLAAAADAGLLRLLVARRFAGADVPEVRGRNWWDDRSTAARIELATDQIADALAAAWHDLESRGGRRAGEWDWPSLHQVHLTHPLGRLPVLAPFFNGPDLRVEGAGDCLLATAFRGTSFDVVALPAMRMIADLSPGGGLTMVLPAGQSGVPASRHYSDLAPLWLAGRDVPVFFSPEQRAQLPEPLVLAP